MTEGPALAGNAGKGTPSAADKLAVFISYSRKDLTTAERLRERLESTEFEAYLDRHDILPGEVWQERLSNLIEGADTVVFLMSPDSASSAVCDWEVNEAERLSKRLLPVVVRDVEAAVVPGRLKRLNYIFMRNAAEEKEAFGKLRAALLTDVEWIRDHTRIGELALDWQDHGRPRERLQRGSALAGAELWLSSRPREAPEVTALQREYIQESRKAEQAAMAKERTRMRAMQRWLRVLVVLLAVSIAGLTAWLNQDYLKEQYYWRTVMKPSLLSAEQAREIAAKPGSEFKECEHNCPAMIVIPAGEYMMGQDSVETNSPRHKVTISRPFAVAKTELTFAEWDACTEVGACPKASDDRMGRNERPVIEITWEEAQAYIKWLSGLTGRPYRLLTEAEWEYAARGITDASKPHPIYPWGDELGQGNANCRACGSQWDGGRGTSPGGSFKPNAFGLFDMAGNVWEWVEDNWHATYVGAPSDAAAWAVGGDQDRRVLRGGSWKDYPATMTDAPFALVGSAGRTADRSYVRQNNIGFRIARTLN